VRIDLLLNVATATLEDKNCSPFSTSHEIGTATSASPMPTGK
jgi:hypothetical protein